MFMTNHTNQLVAERMSVVCLVGHVAAAVASGATIASLLARTTSE